MGFGNRPGSSGQLSRVGGSWWPRQIGVSTWLRTWQRYIALGLVGICLSVAIAGCGGMLGWNLNGGGNPTVELTLVSFAVTRTAHESIIPKFAAKWKQDTGQTVKFSRSYGGSGAQTRAVIDGLDADVVHLALALDTRRLEKAGLIQPNWELEAPNGSIVSKSVTALITREGNPKGIHAWSDLARTDVKWVTADPKTSGIARWNFMALWNAALQDSRDEAKAQQFVTEAFKNVPVLARDGREASDVFLNQGQGDALINYENEIILAEQKGQKAAYVIPDVNISVDNPIAVVDKNVDKHGTRAVAEAFVQFLYSPEAQAEFAKVGFRPVTPEIAQQPEFVVKFPVVKTLAKIKDYGGWDQVQKKFFADGAIFDQIRH